MHDYQRIIQAELRRGLHWLSNKEAELMRAFQRLSNKELLQSLAVAFSIIYLARLIARRSSRLPPGPRPLPLIGSMLSLGDKPHLSLARLAKSYGPVMSLKLGHVITVVISSPEMSREVLQKHDLDFASRSVPDAVRAYGHSETSVAWLPPGPQWRRLRRICNTELFTVKRLDANQGMRVQKVKELMNYVSESCTQVRTVDIGRVAFVATLNLVTKTIFSVDLISPYFESSHKLKDLVQQIMEEAGSPNVSDFFPWLAGVDLQGRRRRFGNNLAKLHTILDKEIDHRLQTMADGTNVCDDLLGALLTFHDADESQPMLDRRTIKSFISDLFAAGSDTSSNTVEWAMSELLRNPGSMAKAQEELERVIGRGRVVEESDIGRLPYLQAAVKETLRLHPPVPLLLPRKTEAATELAGYIIPSGTKVLVNVWAIGRDPKVWAEPERFMPERFLGKEMELRGKDFELTPFGAGRRICPGMPLALRMVQLMLASLLHGFRWKLPGGMRPQDLDLSEKFGITLSKATPLLAIPIPVPV